MAVNWLWALNPSPAYVGQGALMGPTVAFHMFVGAIIGWGILSPLAKSKGWAPDAIDDWEEGSKGWIMWISLALMLADSLINLGWLVLRPLLQLYRGHLRGGGNWPDFLPLRKYYQGSTSQRRNSNSPNPSASQEITMHDSHEDAPHSQQVSNMTVAILLSLSLIFCVICTHLSFGPYITLGTTTVATLLALLASVMGIRATGETDLTPASGIGKLGQLLISLLISRTNPNAIIINLLVGTILASGASQASHMMQNFKTAHLLHSSPRDQFYGQVIGSVFGVVVTPLVYRLYVRVYELPSQLFQMPGAYIWIFTARLLTGKGLPPMVWQFGVVAGLITICTTILRIYLGAHRSGEVRNLQRFVPGGIAMAVGMYTTPSFSIPRAFGGLLSWWYLKHHPHDETTVVVIASGLILGEGILSMLNLGLASMNVPHL
jgi:OPT family oligopeptide transporter